MIRKLQKADLNDVANLWLDTNLKAHNFISAEYWNTNFEFVKEMLPQAEVYVYENDKKIQGFIGLNGEYIEGIFVAAEMQSRGIGKLLLDYAKDRKSKLLLKVYQKNTRAVRFYQREGFEIQSEGVDDDTGEKDYAMIWQQNALQLGYKIGFINDSQVWLLMLKKYNTSVYSYNEDEVDEMIMLIHDSFVPAFTDVKDILLKKLEEVESDWM